MRLCVGSQLFQLEGTPSSSAPEVLRSTPVALVSSVVQAYVGIGHTTLPPPLGSTYFGADGQVCEALRPCSDLRLWGVLAQARAACMDRESSVQWVHTRPATLQS